MAKKKTAKKTKRKTKVAESLDCLMQLHQLQGVLLAQLKKEL